MTLLLKFFVHERISPPISIFLAVKAVKYLLDLHQGRFATGQPSSLFYDLTVWENFRNKKRHLFLPEFSMGSKGDKARFFLFILSCENVIYNVFVSSFGSVTPSYTDKMYSFKLQLTTIHFFTFIYLFITHVYQNRII